MLLSLLVHALSFDSFLPDHLKGQLYYSGAANFPANKEKAFIWLSKAAELGDAEAHFYLGNILNLNTSYIYRVITYYLFVQLQCIIRGMGWKRTKKRRTFTPKRQPN